MNYAQGTRDRAAVESPEPQEDKEEEMLVVGVEDGKYELRFQEEGDPNPGRFDCLRYGEYWRDLTGDALVLCLAQRITELEKETGERAPRGREVTAADIIEGCTLAPMAGWAIIVGYDVWGPLTWGTVIRASPKQGQDGAGVKPGDRVAFLAQSGMKVPHQERWGVQEYLLLPVEEIRLRLEKGAPR